jgi:Rab family protein
MADAEEKPPIFKIVLIGDQSVGKTHLLTRYLRDQIPRVPQATIGVEFATKVFSYNGGKEVTVSIIFFFVEMKHSCNIYYQQIY